MADPRPATESEIRAEALIRELIDDPHIGRTVRERAKQKFPEAGLTFPQDRIEPELKSLTDRIDTLAKSIDDDRKSREEAATKQREEAEFTSVKERVEKAVAKYGFTDEARTEILDRLKQQKSLDVEGAAAWVAEQHPPPPPPGPSYSIDRHNDFYGSAEKNEEFRLLHTDPSGRFVDDQLRKFFDNPDKYVQEAPQV